VDLIDFADETALAGFDWMNRPPHTTCKGGLHIRTAPDTDFWQRTHYGFRRDSGHFLHRGVRGDFTLETQVSFEPTAQYDQCGVMVRVDGGNWIKASVEFEDAAIGRLGSVVTSGGYSDWASQDIASSIGRVEWRMSRRGDDFLVEARLPAATWQQLRVCHLHEAGETLLAGLYACSPTGAGFACTFESLRIGPCTWPAHN